MSAYWFFVQWGAPAIVVGCGVTLLSFALAKKRFASLPLAALLSIAWAPIFMSDWAKSYDQGIAFGIVLFALSLIAFVTTFFTERRADALSTVVGTIGVCVLLVHVLLFSAIP